MQYVEEGVNLFARSNTLYFNNGNKLYKKTNQRPVELINDENYIAAKFGEAWIAVFEVIEKKNDNWLDVHAQFYDDKLLVAMPFPTKEIYLFDKLGLIVTHHFLEEPISAIDINKRTKEIITLSDDGSLLSYYSYENNVLVLVKQLQLKVQYTQMCYCHKGILLVNTSEQKVILCNEETESDWLKFEGKIFDIISLDKPIFYGMFLGGIYQLEHDELTEEK